MGFGSKAPATFGFEDDAAGPGGVSPTRPLGTGGVVAGPTETSGAAGLIGVVTGGFAIGFEPSALGGKPCAGRSAATTGGAGETGAFGSSTFASLGLSRTMESMSARRILIVLPRSVLTTTFLPSSLTTVPLISRPSLKNTVSARQPTAAAPNTRALRIQEYRVLMLDPLLGAKRSEGGADILVCHPRQTGMSAPPNYLTATSVHPRCRPTRAPRFRCLFPRAEVRLL